MTGAKPIRLCFVSLYAYHLFNPAIRSRFGGAELQVYYLATELAKDRGFDVMMVVGDFGQPAVEVRHGVTLYKCFNPRPRLKYTRAVGAFCRLWRELDRMQADLYVQRAAGLETGAVALYCKARRKRFVYMIAHDDDVSGGKPPWMGHGPISEIRWRCFLMGLRNATLVFAQHRSQQDDLERHYHRPSRLRMSAHVFADAPSVDDKRYVLWVGRAEDWKQPAVYLDLAEKCPHRQFVMIMLRSSDERLFRRIRARAATVSNVRFVDFVRFDRVDEFFAGANVLVNTSRAEGFPNAFIQAASERTPILSLNVDPGGVFKRRQLGFCASGDVEALCAKLNEWLGSEGLRRRWGDNAYAYARDHHHLNDIIEDDKRIFRDLVEPSRVAGQ